MPDPIEIINEYRSANKTMTIKRDISFVKELNRDRGGFLVLKCSEHWEYLSKFMQKGLNFFEPAKSKPIGICCIHVNRGERFIFEAYYWILEVEKWADVDSWCITLGREIT